MNVKLFLLVTIVLSLTTSYELEGDVLVLGDNDFPKVLEEHPYILIEFYAPWCGHCKSLAPVYTEAATELKTSGSEIKLAKVDATIHKTQAGEYGVRGFPTLFFFINGTKIDYKGDRTKDGIISWVNKKILPVTSEVANAEQFAALAASEAVEAVLFSNDASQIEAFQNLARADDYNRYYIATGDFLGTQESGTVRLIRNFDEEAVFNGDFSTLGAWIAKNSRPSILPFDQRTIQSIFGEAKQAFIFINTGSDEAIALRETIIAQAKSHSGSLLFTQITKDSEHFDRFGDYIKVPVTQPRVLIVDGGKQKKYVQLGRATSESVTRFLKSYVSGDAKEYGLTDSVEIDTATPEEEL